ncbi:hypothetical protein IU459_12045 [Nocardia amamiensis]|uniref:Uncharacterized protein n=1 Tax=Nocardia amamiensis TaxID=404578 RepID=A0ABS0CU28_9NOCA|nr:hypothetical protein [Nocardia amamiensis]MBF6298273.1 hypothetical protein [Nocardia amamiensis]
MSSADEIARILNAAENLLRDAAKSAGTDPAHTRHQIESAIGTMQSVRGFLL